VAKDGDGVVRGAGSSVVAIGDGRVDAELMLDPNDFVVNTTYAGSQDLAFRADGGGRQLAVTSDGVFTIGWSDTCQMVGRCDVFGRRFDATATPVNTAIAAGPGQFNINQTDGETGFEPSLATDRSGNTVAAWTTLDTTYAVVIDAAGAAVTPVETVITTATAPGTPAVSVFPDGRFVVAWSDDGPMPPQTQIMARLLGASGQPINNPITNTAAAFAVSTTTTRTIDETPAVTTTGTGSGLAFAWRDGDAIRGRFYGAGGTPLGPELTLASHPGEQLGPPQLAMLGTDVVLLYRRKTTSGTANEGQLLLRRYTPSGAGIGIPVVVADDVEAGPAALAIGGTDVGVAWAACLSASDGAGCGIRFRAFDANLAPAGDPLQVNSTTAGEQEDPSVGWLPDRSLVATWSDTSATDPDRDASAVRARIIYPF
jgi:hypothetical protein